MVKSLHVEFIRQHLALFVFVKFYTKFPIISLTSESPGGLAWWLEPGGLNWY